MGLVDLANKRPYKFFINKETVFLSVIIFFLCFVVVFILSSKINEIEEIAIPTYISSDKSDKDTNILQKRLEEKVILCTIKDILVVICTILGTNFLLSLLIQKKSQNDLYDEFLTEDLLQNKKFIESMPENNRKILLKYIEKIDYLGDNEIYSELISNVRDKIVNYKYKYYFETNNTSIICTILPDCIEKKITKTYEAKSFKKEELFDEFPFAQSSLEPIEGRRSIEITSLKINDEIKDVSKFIDYKTKDSENIYHKNSNYTKKIIGFYKDPMKFYSDKTTKVEVVYTTYVPLRDRVYTTRLSAPCKKYDFRFRINDSTKQYILHSQAFGFQEDATKTPAGCQPNEISYTINDWTFPADGVFITFNE